MSSDVTVTLKPCRWCGGKAKCNELRRGNYKREGDNYQVVCNKCRARGPLIQDSPAQAIAAWNTRATHAQVEPVAWMYVRPGWATFQRDPQSDWVACGWTETPLYTQPPAQDVAALVKALEPFAEAWAEGVARPDAQGYSRTVMAAEYFERAHTALAKWSKP